eukprot:402309_1
MEFVKTWLWKQVHFITTIFGIYSRQSKLVRITTGISVGIGLFVLNATYKQYKYNEKQFKIIPQNTSNKAILITGCGSGIGETLAFELNKLGFIVIATCRRKESVENIYLSNKSFVSNGSKSFVLDISNKENILNTKKEIKSFLKANNLILWGIVNNAGITYATPFEFHSYDVIKKVFDINLNGTINICHQFLPLIYGRTVQLKGYKSANGGRIVNISSVAGKYPFINASIYSTAKRGVSFFTKILRMEISPRFGIYCSCIEAGAFKTKMTTVNAYKKDWDNSIMDIKQNRKDDGIEQHYKVDAEMSMVMKQHEEQKDLAYYDDLTVVTDDIIHALTARNPQPVYDPGVMFLMKIMFGIISERSLSSITSGIDFKSLYQ